MKAFLYHILNNLIVDEYRKKKHETESLDTLIEKGFEPRDEESERVTNFIDGKAALRLIVNLPEIYKKIVHMRFVQGMSLKEISLITGQTKNAISVKIHRGLEKLKALYERVPQIVG
jgi:RNA polymerase sigma factor (sigma-70 family)